jgi:hypothetical protein
MGKKMKAAEKELERSYQQKLRNWVTERGTLVDIDFYGRRRDTSTGQIVNVNNTAYVLYRLKEGTVCGGCKAIIPADCLMKAYIWLNQEGAVVQTNPSMTRCSLPSCKGTWSTKWRRKKHCTEKNKCYAWHLTAGVL